MSVESRLSAASARAGLNHLISYKPYDRDRYTESSNVSAGNERHETSVEQRRRVVWLSERSESFQKQAVARRA